MFKTNIERRQSRLQANGEELEYALKRMFIWMRKIEKLRAERKRLLGPKSKRDPKARKMTLEEIRERHAAGGDEFNDEIPS